MSKQSVFNFIVFFFGLVFFFCLNFFLLQEEKTFFSSFSLFLSVLALGIFLCLSFLFSEKKSLPFLVSLVLIILFLIFFGINLYFLLGILLIFLSFVFAYQEIQREKEQRKKIHLSKILRRGVFFIYLSLVLFILFAFCFGQEISGKEIKISERMIDLGFKSLEKPISLFLPEFKRKMTVDELINLLFLKEIERQAANLKKEAAHQIIVLQIEKEEERMKEKTLKEVKENFSQKLGIEITGKEKLSQIISGVINLQLEKLIVPYKEYLSMASFLILFSFSLALRPIFSSLIIFLCFVIFNILKRMGIVKIIEKEEKVEEIFV